MPPNKKGAKSAKKENTFQGISRHVWESLVAEYRIRPAAHGAVAKAVGVGTRTAKRYWLEGGGSSRRPWCLESIKSIIEREQLALRSELQLDRETAERATALELGKLDALRARADRVSEQTSNVQLARVVKAQVFGLCSMLQEVLDGVGGAAAEGLKAIFEGDAFTLMATSSPDKALRHVRTLVKIVKELGEATETVVKLERLLLGESTENTSHQHQVQHTFETQDDAFDVIRRANAAAQRVRGAVVDVEARAIGASDASE